MSDPNPAAEAGAGAEALLGLAAGGVARLPRLSSLPARSPEPPPLALPSPHSSAPLYPTAPQLSLPSAQPTSHAPLLPPPREFSGRLRPSPYLPPPHRTDPSMPRLESISTWAGAEHTHSFRGLHGAGFDHLHTGSQPQRLNPLQASRAPSSQPLPQPQSTVAEPLPLPAPWEPSPPLRGTQSLPSAASTRDFARAGGHWVAHPAAAGLPFAGSLMSPSSPYIYYHNPTHPPKALSSPSMHMDQYSLPPPHTSTHAPTQIPSLPLPLPATCSTPSAVAGVTGSQASSICEGMGLRPSVPTMNARFDVKENSSVTDVVNGLSVTKVADETKSVAVKETECLLGDHSLLSNLRRGEVNDRRQDSNLMKKLETNKTPRPARRGDLLALMNPTDEIAKEKGRRTKASNSGTELVVTEASSGGFSGELSEPKIEGKQHNERNAERELRTVKVESVRPLVASKSEKGRKDKISDKQASGFGENGKMLHAKGIDDNATDDTPKGEDSAESEVTRCPCGSAANSGFMVACDQCNAWQHGRCMGFRRSSDVPDKYFCNICRPDNVRVGCVAHPRYKERNLSKDREGKDSRRDHDPLLASVKPLELRKHFLSDLKQKRSGAKLSKSKTFYRYAALLRSDFGKYRQSVIEGLTVILELNRGNVIEKLDHALKKHRTGSSSKVTEGGPIRDQSVKLGEGMPSDTHSSKSNSQVRNNTQKRPRPHSLDDGDAGAGAVGCEEVHSVVEPVRDPDGGGANISSGRSNSREERKLQATLKLFAQMEERERERKKPRTAETGTSPKRAHQNRPKTPRSSTQIRATPPKDVEPSGIACSSEDGVGVTSASMVDLDCTTSDADGGPHEHANDKLLIQSQPPEWSPHQSSTKTLPAGSLLIPDASRETPSRERELRGRDRGEKQSLRRKENASPEGFAHPATASRRSMQERDRSRDPKGKRLISAENDTETTAVMLDGNSEESKCLDFECWLPGPSVLQSRKITRPRMSALDREELEREEADEKEKQRSRSERSDKKQWLLTAAAESRKQKTTQLFSSPMKKRYCLDKNREALHVVKEEAKCTEEQVQGEEDDHEQSLEMNTNGTNRPVLSVSMVVVSAKTDLPDKGQIFEASRLVCRNAEHVDSHGNTDEGARKSYGCLKKRPRMLASYITNEEVKNVQKTEPQQTLLPASTARESESPPSPPLSPTSPGPSPKPSVTSPKPCVPSSSPRRVRSPMLRSSPVPRAGVTGLRSVSPPANGLGVGNFPTASSPKTGTGSPVVISRSPSPDMKRKSMRPSLAEKSSPAVGKEARARSCADVRKSPVRSNLQDASTPASRISSPNLSKLLPSHAAPASVHERNRNSEFNRGVEKIVSGNCNGLGLRSVRSPSAPRVPNIEEFGKRVQCASDFGKLKEFSKTVLQSPKGRPSTCDESTTISDFLLQRLQGSLKPLPVGSLPNTLRKVSGIGSGAVNTSSAEPHVTRAAKDVAKVSGEGMVLDTPGGSAALKSKPSFRSKPLESSILWRKGGPAFQSSKGSIGSIASDKTTSGIPLDSPNGTPPIASVSEKGRYVNGRTEHVMRGDVHGRSGFHGPAWNVHGHKNGWGGGIGRGQQAPSDSAGKPIRRGRR